MLPLFLTVLNHPWNPKPLTQERAREDPKAAQNTRTRPEARALNPFKPTGFRFSVSLDLESYTRKALYAPLQVHVHPHSLAPETLKCLNPTDLQAPAHQTAEP